MNTPEDEEDTEHSKVSRPSVAIETIGCKLNQAESESLARGFVQAGFNVVSPYDLPDVYILNTCTVTHVADRKCRQRLRFFRRLNPDALIVALGCYVDRDPRLDHVEAGDSHFWRIGNDGKHSVVEMLANRFHDSIDGSCGLGEERAPSRTRSLVRIQEGCNQQCSYCIVPSVRGRERSVPESRVVDEVKARVSEGYNEVILTGTRVGTYEGDGGLEGLIRRILEETSMPRIRLSSLQPQELSSSLLDLWEDNRLCRHLHLALQSGSDSVLKRMGRGYSIPQYRETVNWIRDAFPDMAITTDVVVGFPGESEEEFEESYRFCDEIGFARLHVFPYSVRPGTRAARMDGKVSEKVKKGRVKQMLDLAGRSARDFRRSFSGTVRPVLWEERNSNGCWIGYTDNYIKVKTGSECYLGNCLTDTVLGEDCQDSLWGRLAYKLQPSVISENWPFGQRRVSKDD
ncbi:MAG: tRNA (N(6)-L-threonylcarbamoyladenosine(37)-C(2))-methylthiotransferase MtaB [Dehalococcoidia bacterium]